LIKLLPCAFIAWTCATGAGAKPDLQVLRTSNVRADVAAAAVRIAGSGDAAELRLLGDSLSTASFLARLDDSTNPQMAAQYLRAVFQALEKNPSSATEALCLKVMAAWTFTEPLSKANYALPALAAVKPMSPAGESLFAESNRQGYFAFNGPLLAANGSERATALLESMFADTSQSVTERIAMAREAVVPHRTKVSTVRVVDRLAGRPGLEPELVVALVECLYDYKSLEWYGKRRRPPEAPSWKKAAPEARREAAKLGRRLLAERKDLPESLRSAIKAVL
jgi:hypothetical protein